MQLKCVNLLQESRNTTFIAIHNKDAFLSYLELLEPKIIVSLPKNVHVRQSELRVGMDMYPRGAEITKFGTFTDLKQITCLMLHDDKILYLTYMYYVFKH